MIPNFNSYNIIQESISLKELAKGNSRNLGYGDIKRGFLSKGYEFLGNISIKVKTLNAFAFDEILSVVPDELCDKLNEIGYTDYISYVFTGRDKNHLDIGLFGDFDSDKLLKIISEPNIEKVKSCFTKKGDLYYVLWNPDKKYFYFIKLDKAYYCNNYDAIGFLELFIKIKTSGIDEVEKEIEELYGQHLEKVRQREEERKRKEEEKRIKEEEKKEYKQRVDILKKDIEEHPENYKMMFYKDLPDEIKRIVDLDEYEYDPDYTQYIEHGEKDPYEREDATVYVNNNELSNGYKCKITINYARPGTYWGD